MDYQKILKKAVDKLQDKFPQVVEDIEDCISSGSTGGEIISSVGKYVKDLEFKNNEAYNILKNEIQEYLQLCKKNGRIII